jgi:MFS family permease
MADAQVFEQAPGHGGSTRATILLSFGLVANLAALMTFAATLNEIAADWSLDASQSGWIGGIYFAGYAISVPFSASATDRMDARWLYVGSALLGAAASFAFALFAHGFVLAMTLRFLGGVGLAGIHMSPPWATPSSTASSTAPIASTSGANPCAAAATATPAT